MDHRETYFVLRDVVHEVDVSGQTELEASEDQPHRWWTVAEIAAAPRRRSSRAELAERAPRAARGPLDGAAAHRLLKMWHSRELLQTVGFARRWLPHGAQPPDSDGRGVPLSAPRRATR